MYGRVLGVNKIRRRVRISIRVQGRVWVRVRKEYISTNFPRTVFTNF
jgi:hypothetical protein